MSFGLGWQVIVELLLLGSITGFLAGLLGIGGGMLMAVLAVVMLARPELLEQLSGTAFVFGIAAALTAAALLLTARTGHFPRAPGGPAATRRPPTLPRP